MAQNYSAFYLSGRFDDVDAHSINVDALAEMAAADDAPDFRVFIMQAAIKEVADVCDRAAKREWQRDRREDFDDLDPDQAWHHYVHGRTDALAHQLEDEVLAHIEDTMEDDLEDDEDA